VKKVNLILKQLRQHPFKSTGFLVMLAAASYLGYCSAPHGYAELAMLESNVDQVTALGTSLNNVRASLDTLGIKYNEEVERQAGSVFEDGRGYRLTANEGELLLFSRHQTDAWQGPCAEQVWIFLLFDSHGQVVRRHRERFHLCP
jgi:hypothetical protein